MAKWETRLEGVGGMSLVREGDEMFRLHESHANWKLLNRIAALLNEAEPDGEIKKAADLLFTTPGGHGYTVDTLWSLVAKGDS